MTWIAQQFSNLEAAFAEVGRTVREQPRGVAAFMFLVLSFPLSARLGGALGVVLCLMYWLARFATGGEQS